MPAAADPAACRALDEKRKAAPPVDEDAVRAKTRRERAVRLARERRHKLAKEKRLRFRDYLNGSVNS